MTKTNTKTKTKTKAKTSLQLVMLILIIVNVGGRVAIGQKLLRRSVIKPLRSHQLPSYINRTVHHDDPGRDADHSVTVIGQ